MQLLRNRTVLGVLCIALSLLICFGLAPLFNQSAAQKTQIVRVVKEIKNGDEITADRVQMVEVGGYNLPSGVLRNSAEVIGKYAAADLSIGDYILEAKLSAVPAAENAYLYHLEDGKQAMSVTIKRFAAGLSGKLVSGDIVSVLAPDYQQKGSTVILPELTYVEVIGVTASTGYDTDAQVQAEEQKEKALPATVTLRVLPEQAKLLAGLEEEGSLHLSLVYRGDAGTATAFIQQQDQAIQKLYPEPSDQAGNAADGTKGAASPTSSAASTTGAGAGNGAANTGHTTLPETVAPPAAGMKTPAPSAPKGGGA